MLVRVYPAKSKFLVAVTLINTFLSLDENVISKVSGGSVELFRSKASEHQEWAVDQCFELLFTSPYADPDVYWSFLDENPPACAVSANSNLHLLLGGKFEFILKFFCSPQPMALR